MIRKVRNFVIATRTGRNIARALTKILPGSPVIVNSIPKSGTNLLLNVVLSLPSMRFKTEICYSRYHVWGLEALWISERTYLSLVESKVYDLRQGVVYVAHNPYHPEVARFIRRWGIRQILIVRDPRDCAISLARYISDPWVRHMRFYVFDGLTEKQKIAIAIRGTVQDFNMSSKAVPPITKIFEVFEGWIDDPSTLIVKYENFVDEDGKPSPQLTETARKICDFLEIPFSRDVVERVREGMNPARSHTFRVGRAGQWKKVFDRELLEEFERVGGKRTLKVWGYES